MMTEVAQAAYEAGVVGAGGAGFPTHVKLQAKAETLIINAAECEPLLRTDHFLLLSHPELVAEGAKAAAQAVGAREIVLACRVESPAMRSAVQNLCQAHGFKFFEVGNFYPSGDEHILTFLVTGRVVPEGGIPPEVGVLVHNVETLVNLARALKGEPVITTWLTVTGAVREAVVVEAPLGTSVKDLVDVAGGALVPQWSALDGGPMTGNLLPSPDAPVTKTAKGLTILPELHPLIVKRKTPLDWVVRQARSACAQCYQCTLACPRYLLGHSLQPHKVMRAIGYGIAAGLEAATIAMLCPECGLCEFYVCPQGLLPRRICAELKAEFARLGVKNPHRRKDLGPDPFFEFRRIPRDRLSLRIGVAAYDRPAKKVALPPPKRVRLPLKQHAGAPARPKVKEGQRVERGQLIAEPLPGDLGARLHASISGVVTSVTPEEIVIEAG